MKITKIEILIMKFGTDIIFMTTDMPSPFPKGISNNTLVLKFESEKGKGVEYILNNFKGIPTTLINTENGEREEIRND